MKTLAFAIAILLGFSAGGEDHAYSVIPLSVNSRVLRFVSAAIREPSTKTRTREMLERLEKYRPMIEAKLDEANLPHELLAVPAVESMYRADAESPDQAVGLWQLLPETARAFGLRVDAHHDDRLDPARETAAAIQYFAYIYKQQGRSWPLALASYNAGESKVRKLARTEPDVYKLKFTKRENAEYVPKVMAALIIIKHPSLVAAK